MMIQTTKKIFNAVGGGVGKTNELMTVSRTNRDVSPPIARLRTVCRVKVSPSNVLSAALKRVLKSSMLLVGCGYYWVGLTERVSGHEERIISEPPALMIRPERPFSFLQMHNILSCL